MRILVQSENGSDPSGRTFEVNGCATPARGSRLIPFRFAEKFNNCPATMSCRRCSEDGSAETDYLDAPHSPYASLPESRLETGLLELPSANGFSLLRVWPKELK